MLKTRKQKLMMRLNEAIICQKKKGGLSTDYQIGASYFLGIDNGEERQWNNYGILSYIHY